MRAPRLALLLVLTATLAACAAPADRIGFAPGVSHLINYTPRDDRILAGRYPNWLRIEYLGPQTDPINALWLAPALIGQSAPFNDLLVLTPEAWNRSLIRLATTPCPPVAPPDYTALKLTIATAGRVAQRCLASPTTACAYADILRVLTADELIQGELAARQMVFKVCETGFAGWRD